MPLLPDFARHERPAGRHSATDTQQPLPYRKVHLRSGTAISYHFELPGHAPDPKPGSHCGDGLEAEPDPSLVHLAAGGADLFHQADIESCARSERYFRERQFQDFVPDLQHFREPGQCDFGSDSGQRHSLDRDDPGPRDGQQLPLHQSGCRRIALPANRRIGQPGRRRCDHILQRSHRSLRCLYGPQPPGCLSDGVGRRGLARADILDAARGYYRQF